MGYLFCDECKGYYQLQKGESPEDFSVECECGGNVWYIERLDNLNKNFNQALVKCPQCGKEIPENARICKHCHKVLKFSAEKKRDDEFSYKELLKAVNNIMDLL